MGAAGVSLLTGLFVAARVAIWFLSPDRSVPVAWLLPIWTGSALALVHAIWLLDRSRRNATDRASRLVAAAWLLLTGAAVWLWPYALQPDVHPAAMLLCWGSWIGLPAACAAGSPDGSPIRGRVALYLRPLGWSVLLLGVVSAGIYLQQIRSYAGGVDFFFLICNARDMLEAPDQIALNAYRYFPGAYAFWRTVMALGGQQLAWLQAAVIVVAVVNATLCSAIVVRLTRHLAAGVFALLWCLALSSRYQGFTGVMEPLATLPFLAGLLLWGGVPLRGRRGLACALLLGACLGCSLWFKQQAGLLSLGALWLVVNWRLAPAERRHELPPLCLLPLSAVASFLLLILSEGHGWQPLRQGLSMLGSYPAQGSWWHNLYVQVRGDELAFLSAGMVVVSLAWIVLSASRRARWLGQPWLEVTGFCLLAAAATLLQFRTRAYGHYMLLAVPPLVVSAVTLAARQAPRHLGSLSQHPLRWFLVAGSALLLLWYPAGAPASWHIWRVTSPANLASHQLWHRQAAVAADLRELARQIARGETLYVLPPRHHSVHYLLGTRSLEPWGYGFRMPELEQMPWQQFDAVLLLHGGLDESDRQVWTPGQQAEASRILARSGFRPVAQLRTMRLYRRQLEEAQPERGER